MKCKCGSERFMAQQICRHDVIVNEHGSQGDMGWCGLSSNDMEESSWNEKMQAFIESVPDNYFSVSVDCHI